jgi:hypothetical protein
MMAPVNAKFESERVVYDLSFSSAGSRPWARVSCTGDDTGTFCSIDEEAFVDIAEKSRAAKSSAWNEPGSALNAGLF